MIKFIRATTFAIFALAIGGSASQAQDTSPTTKVLAIGLVRPGADQSQLRTILPVEVKDTVDLYLHGRIDQWYSLKDRRGVAFILNVDSVAAARKLLDRLPLQQARIISFELIPLGPLDPLRQLEGAALGPQMSAPSTMGSKSDERR